MERSNFCGRSRWSARGHLTDAPGRCTATQVAEERQRHREDFSCTACEMAPGGPTARARRLPRRRGARGHDTSRGMTPILVSKVRSLQATQEASVPCQVDLRGVSRVGKATTCQSTRIAAPPDRYAALGGGK